MSFEKYRHRVWLIPTFILLFSLSLYACSPAPSQTATPQPSKIPLTPYLTPTLDTQSNADSTANSPAAPQKQQPTPTATPFVYLIQSGDTLLAIAQRYNITLDELLAANPAIDPNFLIVGDEVIIPTGEGSLAAFPLPTPIAVTLEEPNCYPTSDDKLWCLVLVENTHQQSLENISAQITLFDSVGEQVDQKLAIAPLNVVSAGEAIPLAVLFPGPVPKNFSTQAELITALPLDSDSDRYLDINIQIDKTEIAATFGEVEGSVTVRENEEDRPAIQTWLLALALDAEGFLVGIRKWESNSQTLPGDSITFHITVFSLGPPIAEIRVLGEARP